MRVFPCDRYPLPLPVGHSFPIDKYALLRRRLERHAASGEPLESNPGEEGAGFIRQGALEASNVDPVTELVTLIKTQRVFEMNSQVIQAANETLKNISNIRAF